MAPIAFMLYHLIGFFLLVMFIWIIMGWLYVFGILNSGNRVLYQIYQTLGNLVEPALSPLRRLLPSTGGVDISPVLLVIIMWTVQRYVLIPLM